MRNILIVAFFSLPRWKEDKKTHGAALRLGGLVKHLPDFGWQPIVITPRLSQKPDLKAEVIETDYSDIVDWLKKKFRLTQDLALQERLNIIEVNKSREQKLQAKLTYLFKSTFLFPDERIGWYQHALNEAYRFLGNRRVDLILSSSLPSTVHLIARKIKKKYKLPWVADFRDLWSQNHGYPYGSFRHYLERRLEVWTLKEADALVTVSEPLAAKLSTLHRQNRIYSITNGFDPEEFESIREAKTPQKFVITYAGQLHSGKRDPEILFQALEGLIKSGKIDKNKIEVNFYSGHQEAWLYEKVKKYDLHEVVHIHDYIPRREVLRKEASSSLLLLITWDNPEEVGVYTGKVFEYLGVRRPVLAFGGPAGVLSDLLRKTKAGIYTSTLKELKQILLRYYGEYIKNSEVLFHGDEEEISKYTHREMADRFTRVFEEVL